MSTIEFQTLPSSRDASKMEQIVPPIGQFPPPLERVESKYLPWMIKHGRQIVRFDIASLLNFKAIFVLDKTFLLERKTWINIGILFVLALTSSIITAVTGSAKSVNETASEDGSIGSIQALMSFVLGGYVSLVVNRWNVLRNTTLGILWGSLENLVVYGVYLSDRNKENPIIDHLREDLLRYARVVLRLLFSAGRSQDNLDDIRRQGLLINSEYNHLAASMIGTRPLLALMWMWRVFDKMEENGVVITAEGRLLLQRNIDGARGGIGATLGMIGCPFPYAYIHVVHWVVQIYIWILAIDTGVGFAMQFYRTGNGDGAYSTDDRQNYTFPVFPIVWLTNDYLQQLTGNVIYILFSQGLLKTMLKLQNPFNNENTSFPELAYDSFIHNNCRAMMMGLSEFPTLCEWNGNEACPRSGFTGQEDSFENNVKPSRKDILCGR